MLSVMLFLLLLSAMLLLLSAFYKIKLPSLEFRTPSHLGVGCALRYINVS